MNRLNEKDIEITTTAEGYPFVYRVRVTHKPSGCEHIAKAPSRLAALEAAVAGLEADLIAEGVLS